MPPIENQVEQTEEQKTQQEKDADAQFSAAFDKARGVKPEDDKPEGEKTVKAEKADDESGKDDRDDKGAAAPAAAEAKPAAAASAADEWEGVPKVVRDRLQALDTMSTRMRNVEGHIGGLNGTLQQLAKAGKTAATDKGAASPTDAQVEAAINDDEQFAELKKQYPEWAVGIEKQMSVIVARAEKEILKKVQPIDADAMRNDARKVAAQTSQSLEEVIPLYVKHPAWKKDINSPEFMEFALTGGPTKEEFAEFKQLESSNAAKAAERVNEFIRKYPNWWSDKGSRFIEGDVDESISLLDAYAEHRAAKAASTDTPAEKSRREEKNQQRLKAATVPKGSQRPPTPGVISDNEAFERGFNKQARKA